MARAKRGFVDSKTVLTPSGSVFLEELQRPGSSSAQGQTSPSLHESHEVGAATQKLDISAIEESLAEHDRALSHSQESTPTGLSLDQLVEAERDEGGDTHRPTQVASSEAEGSSVEELDISQVVEGYEGEHPTEHLSLTLLSSPLRLDQERAQQGDYEPLAAKGYPPVFSLYRYRDEELRELREVLLPSQQTRGLTTPSRAPLLLRGYRALISSQLAVGVPRVIAMGSSAEPWVTLSAPPLTQRLTEHRGVKGERDWRRVIGWIWQLSYVMSLSHAQRVVHLNLSPRAVGVTAYGVYLTAWEAAQVLDAQGEAEPTPAELVYEPGWAAPELVQASGGLTSPKRADVYGLGALFFWLLTGEELPADERARTAKLSSIWAIPEALKEVTLKALSLRPEARPLDAEVVFQALFKSEALPLKATLQDSSTLELSISEQAQASRIAQLAFNAKVPFEATPFPIDEISAQPDVYIGLKPRARLTVEGLSDVVGATICSDHSPQSPVELSARQVLEVGSYLVRWSIGARHCEWRVSLTPLADRSLTLGSPLRDGWSLIPSGPSWSGSARAGVGEVSLHTVELKSFEVSERLVSCAEYHAFLQTLSPEYAQLRTPIGPWGATQWGSSAPVTGVSPSDALAYANWRGEERLLTCAEWEKVTRGESTRERLDEQARHTLADLNAGYGELCLSQAGSTSLLIKGGRWSFGLIGASQVASEDVKCAEVGFRLARSV